MGKPISVPAQQVSTLKAKAASPILQVTVRCAFFNPSEGECLSPGEGIAGVTFELDGAPVAKVTTAISSVTTGVAANVAISPKLGSRSRREVGIARLPLTDVADGDHQLRIVPRNAASDAAGPATPDSATRLFRPLDVTFSIGDGKLTAASTTDGINYGYVTGFADGELAVDLKPVWMRSTAHGSNRSTISSIVVHHTSGAIISGAVHEALNTKGPHYEIDLDGHVVKYVQDSNAAWHAGAGSRWKGAQGLNSRSIGIEVVNQSGPFTEAQYQSLLELLEKLVAAHGIARTQVVAHADVRTGDPDAGGDPTLLNDDRQNCPGREFEWERLEAAGFCWNYSGGELGNYYDGYFSRYAEGTFKHGDNDAHQLFNGHKTKDVGVRDDSDPNWVGPITELQQDLEHIGYSLHVNGVYDLHTQRAVDRFQRRYFSGSRKGDIPDKLLGTVDGKTAMLIKTVRESLP
jgi:N-acetyl-anhydromuramyl-L-alanine amidase AmpD